MEFTFGTQVLCPKCGHTMPYGRISEDDRTPLTIECPNPNCVQHKVEYRAPTIELEPVDG
jgi:hypothetical protein